jgi:putative flavoprotein involved in K+ transport
MTSSRRTSTVIVGGGQAGLAMSRCLSDRSIDHVVLERGRVAERWRSERWESLRLLTPNWQSRLPGWRYQGPDPDGYMTIPELIDYLEGYARSFSAPVEGETTVLAVEEEGARYRVTTDRGVWSSENVVIATGYCDIPFVPELATRLPADILQLVPTKFCNPGQLPEGGVLVVGASASGIQLADEIHASGRPVTLAVGRHTRLPRTYRGRDILWWLDAMGIFDETSDDVFDIDISREQPSLQLVGRPDQSTLDLPLLQERGVRLAGRAIDAENYSIAFDDRLIAYTAGADAKLALLLRRIDSFISETGLENQVSEAEPFAPFFWPAPSPNEINLRSEGIKTVLWATGFRRSYPWLKVPVLNGRGEIIQRGGLTPAPGLHVLGLQFQVRRKSAFIDGVGDDAAELTAHIHHRLSHYQGNPGKEYVT